MQQSVFRKILSEGRELSTGTLDVKTDQMCSKRTRATTDISSAQADGSPWDTCCRLDLMSSSLTETSPITLLAPNWANCFAAVFLTEVEDPVSSRRRSLSNLELLKNEWNIKLFVCDLGTPRSHAARGYPGRVDSMRVYLGLFTGGMSVA
jgi:hypothetical protein